MEKKGRGTPWILLELNVRSVYRDYFKFCTVYLKGKNNYPVIRNVKFAVKKFKEGRKEIFYLMTHSTHFHLRLSGVRHMVKDHSDSERGNPLLPHGLLFLISSKGSFIYIISQTE